MIAKLYGAIDEIFDDRILLNVNGIFFEVLCSTSTIASLSIGQSTTLWTEHIIREDSQTLCGFLSYNEKLWFKEITSVQGIGMKVALSVLSSITINEISSAILNKDPVVLTRANGVGKKVAERLITELKNSKLLINCLESYNQKDSKVETDAIDALVSLGYDKSESRRAVIEASKNFDGSTENLLKLSLAFLFRK